MATNSLDLFTQIKESYTNALKSAGVPIRFSKSDIETARKSIADNSANTHDGFGFVESSAYGDILAVMAYRVAGTNEKANKAIHDMAVTLAITDSLEVWKHVTSPMGKPYKTFAAFGRDILPQLGESTVRNYISVAREVYLPILNKELPGLEFLDEVPVGTLSLVKSGISNESVRPAFMEEVAKRRSEKLALAVGAWNKSNPETRGQEPLLDDMKLSARELQAALKAAKERTGETVKEVEPAPKVNSEQLKADLAGANDVPVNQADKEEDVSAALVKRVKALFEGDDAVITAMKNDVEFHIMADADAKRSIIDALAKAAVNGPAAMEFCNQLLKLFR